MSDQFSVEEVGPMLKIIEKRHIGVRHFYIPKEQANRITQLRKKGWGYGAISCQIRCAGCGRLAIRAFCYSVGMGTEDRPGCISLKVGK